MLEQPKKVRFSRLFWIVLCLMWLAPQNLWAEDQGKAVLGKHTYRSYCATCHGAEGKGDGSIAEYLNVKPSDLTVLSKNNGGEFPAERARTIIDGREKVKGHGTGEMPAWGDAFLTISDNEQEVAEKIDQLVHFLESIQVE